MNNSWSKRTNSNNTEWYKCQNCCVKLKLVYNIDGYPNKSCQLYISDQEHNHITSTKPKTGLPEIVKKRIEFYRSLNLKPKQMLTELRIEGIEPPKKSQLNRYLAELNKKKLKNENNKIRKIFLSSIIFSVSFIFYLEQYAHIHIHTYIHKTYIY